MSKYLRMSIPKRRAKIVENGFCCEKCGEEARTYFNFGDRWLCEDCLDGEAHFHYAYEEEVCDKCGKTLEEGNDAVYTDEEGNPLCEKCFFEDHPEEHHEDLVESSCLAWGGDE